jgi:hypothetical protein
VTKKIFLSLAILVCISGFAYAEITFTAGIWETTFDCDDWESRLPSYDYILSCDGMVRASDASLLTGDKVTTLSSAANMESGGGSKGIRFWKGSGADNIYSGTVRVNFPSAQQEIWIRWYEKYESGFEWNNSLDVKSLYFTNSPDQNSHPYVGFMGSGYRFYWGGSASGPWPGYDERSTSSVGGWDDIYDTEIADGTWHCFEIHMKMDTDGTDGEGRIWVDGELVDEETEMDWSDIDDNPGWTHFSFLLNHKDPGLERPYYVDFDDLSVYTVTPSNQDASGNPMIGPIDWAETPSQSGVTLSGVTIGQ